MKVAVVGCGYVGLVTAVGLASVGHHVVGIEMDPDRRASIAAGMPPFHEPGLADLLQCVQGSGTFDIADNVARVREAKVVLLAVQTPPGPDGAIDLGPLSAAAESVGAVLANDTDRRVVATRSTIVPGTAERTLQPLLDADTRSPTTVAAANPEFLREGSAVEDFLRPDRVVVGCHHGWGGDILCDLYQPLGAPVIATSPATAELAKYTSNAFLATLISFSNEIAQICENLAGVDVEDVLGILHTDRRLRVRIGEHEAAPAILDYLRAGCGYGGSCLPKDLSALTTTRHRDGAATPLLEAVRAVNDSQPVRFVQLAKHALGGLIGRRCAVLGLAFKSGTDDLRASPGLATIAALTQEGASVVAYDPLVRTEHLVTVGADPVELADTLEQAVTGADACLVTTADPAFSKLPDLLEADSAPFVIDGRRVLSPNDFPPGTYFGVGRSPSLRLSS